MKWINAEKQINHKFKSLKNLGITESVTLVEGFINTPLTQESTETSIVGRSVPMIMFVGNKTGRVYLFALKALDLDINDTCYCKCTDGKGCDE